MSIFSKWFKQNSTELSTELAKEVSVIETKQESSTLPTLSDTDIYICQYSATGVFFYTAYQKDEELYSVSRLVGPPDTRIHTKEADYYTANVCDDAFYAEENKVAVTMTRTAENEYVFQDENGTFRVSPEVGGFCGYCGEEKLFEAIRIEDLSGVRSAYPQDGYDLEYAYQISVLQEVPELWKVWMGALPMLRIFELVKVFQVEEKQAPHTMAGNLTEETLVYKICFNNPEKPYVPYYCLEGEEEHWREAPSRGMFYYDPVEDTLQYKKICKQVDKKMDKKTKSVRGKFGSCHQIWNTRKRILKEEYGMDWHTPQEMNPSCHFD